MQGTDSPTFRPTVWPAEPPRPPSVTRYKLVPAGAPAALRIAQPLGGFELPPDFVFRELLEEPRDDYAALTARWGLLSLAGASTFQYLADSPTPGVLEDLAAWHTAGLPGPLVHSVALGAHLTALQALSQHLLAYLEGAGDAAICAAWRDIGGAPTSSVAAAWWSWEWYINRGLSVFAVHVRAEPMVSDTHRLTRPVPNLYSASCLQLANYLAGDEPVLRCANVRCGKPFTRQRGRARDEYGQHRSRGVRYCSHLCAKAQSERDRRRRRADEGESG